MASLTLSQFIAVHRQELIGRCKVKVDGRSASGKTATHMGKGVPLFLDQLIAELRDGPSHTTAINDAAARHGRELSARGFNISQIVHDYGDVCQSVTDLAVEINAPITTEEFRTLNRCLDDAIAGAVTQHANEREVTRDGHSNELRTLLDTAVAAFAVLRTGTVGVAGSTGNVLERSLVDLREAIERQASRANREDEHR
jgi:hypothetical protein